MFDSRVSKIYLKFVHQIFMIELNYLMIVQSFENIDKYSFTSVALDRRTIPIVHVLLAKVLRLGKCTEQIITTT